MERQAMLALLPTETGLGSRRLRLDTLIRLRWLAVAGQTAAVLAVALGLGFSLPLGPCFALIALSAWLNLALRLRHAASFRLAPRAAALILAYDVLQLAALLHLTGGLQNPFAFLFLVPVMVSATTLPPRHTALLGLLVLASASLIGVWHRHLPWYEPGGLQLPPLYIAGVWVALASSLVFMAVYAWRVAEEARQLAEALTATELVLAREQHITALDGLAAAAAHELGTPMSTIALVAKELGRELPPESPYAEDVTLLNEQIGRCRTIMAKLTSLSSGGDALFARMSLPHLIEEVVEPHRDFGIEIASRCLGEGAEPVVRRNAGLIYGLGNILENAIDFAHSRVDIEARWDRGKVTITVADDGPGFAPDVLGRLGEPYVTTRGRDGRRSGGELGGLGLGFFIAKTLLERSGAQIKLANRLAPEKGAHVTVSWPRKLLDAGESTLEPAKMLAETADAS